MISTLNIVQSNPKALRARGVGLMRQKLLGRVSDQIALIQAHDAGQSFQRVKYRRVRDLESDEITETPVRTRVRPWWVQDKDGSFLLWIRYGNQILDLQKGKTAIRVKAWSDMIPTLEKIADAVRAGEFDNLLLAAVGTFKVRFRK